MIIIIIITMANIYHMLTINSFNLHNSLRWMA